MARDGGHRKPEVVVLDHISDNRRAVEEGHHQTADTVHFVVLQLSAEFAPEFVQP